MLLTLFYFSIKVAPFEIYVLNWTLVSISTVGRKGIPRKIPLALAWIPSVANYSYSDISYALTSSFMTKIKYFRGVMIKNIFRKIFILTLVLFSSRLRDSWTHSRDQLWFLSKGRASIGYNLLPIFRSFIVILISSRHFWMSPVWSTMRLMRTLNEHSPY